MHPRLADHDTATEKGFKDTTLATLQFAAALQSAVRTGTIAREHPAIGKAARRVKSRQGLDGAWRIDPEGSLGSPGTWGTPIATAMGVRFLREFGQDPTDSEALRRGEMWVQNRAILAVEDAAASLLVFAAREPAELDRDALSGFDAAMKFLLGSQGENGGWGPYKSSPPETFDTALALLALRNANRKGGPHPARNDAIDRGRGFLLETELPDGGWRETTRPPGGTSYAQHISTTAWAVMALLATADQADSGHGAEDVERMPKR